MLCYNITYSISIATNELKMSVFKTRNLKALKEPQKHDNQLAVLEREGLRGADDFFQKLIKTSFNVMGQVFKETSLEDIKYFLQDEILGELQSEWFYEVWIADMADICNIFCDILGTRSVSFSLSTQRTCLRYHTDNVPMRLLVTYHGKGTEWIPDEAADRKAFESGMENAVILRDPGAREFINAWDIAIFRGGRKGLLHRTPDAALDGRSILMRVDHETFWDEVFERQSGNTVLEGVK